jgi:hypothetical protein
MVAQLHAAGNELATRVSAALTQDVVDDLTESERHLLRELRAKVAALESQLAARAASGG